MLTFATKNLDKLLTEKRAVHAYSWNNKKLNVPYPKQSSSNIQRRQCPYIRAFPDWNDVEYIFASLPQGSRASSRNINNIVSKTCMYKTKTAYMRFF